MSKLVVIPGRTRLKIPTVFDRQYVDQSAIVTRSPEWRVSFDKIANGNIKTSSGQYIELYGWTTESSRYISGDLNGKLFVSGSLKNTDLVMIIPHGPHGPVLEERMYHGTLIKELTISRFAWKEGASSAILSFLFKDVRIVRFQHNPKYYIVWAQVRSKTTHVWVYQQDTGKAKGNKMSFVDYGTADTEQQKIGEGLDS